jgi:tetratricopeptide (TPR) repeat protein
MCRRPRVVLFSLLVTTMNVSAQDSAPPPRSSSPKEKAQALAALTEARGAVFPQRRKDEARQLLARIAPLLAAAGDAAGAQDVLTLLPASEREAIQLEIVAAQLRSGEIAAALETATAISTDNVQAAALLLIVQAQAKSKDLDGAMRTAALIAAGRVESVQALVEMAKEQKHAGKHSEASQLLGRAATAAASLMNSNEGAPECGLSVLAQIANEYESMGESTEAVKTLRLAESRVPEADQGCRFGTTRYLQNEDEGQPEALQNEIAEFRERLVPSTGLAGNEEQKEEDSSSDEGSAADSRLETPPIHLRQLVQNQQPTLTREQARAALDSLRSVKPLYQRAQAAMGISLLMLAKGKTGEAEEAIHIGLEVADTVQDENLRGMLLASKAHARAAAKDWEGARAAVEEIANGPQRTAALVDIAFCAAERGHAQLALSWATAEASPFSEASVLVSIAEALLHRPQQQTFFIR